MSIDTTKIIHAPVGGGRYTVTAPIVKEDYGLYLKIEGLELPSTYEVDFSNSEHNGTSVTMIGNSDGVLIPNQFISSGKDVFAFLYHVGVDFGRTVYKFRIPNKLRPDRTDEEPTPEEQSVIDQAISALNSAVTATAQDVIDADASAQSASQSAENAHDSAVDAQNYAESASGYVSDAQGYANTASQKATEAGNSADRAAQIKTDIERYVSTAQTAAHTATDKAAQASQSATNASNSATTASTKAGEASASATTASNKASEASGYATTASNKAIEASGYASTASQKASDASDSASAALGYKTDAESAKTAAQTAQGLAEDAQEAAESAAASVSASAAQIATNTADIADLQTDVAQNEADILKAFPTDSASGAIASFPDGADDIPLKSLIVDINPVQDLSQGDPSPENICPISGWDGVKVTRTGKNLLPMEIQSGSYSNGVTITVNPDLSITYNKPNGNNWTTNWLGTFWLPAGTYTIVEDDDLAQNGRISLKKLPDNTEILNTRWNKRLTFTLTEATQIYADFSRASKATDLVIKFMIFEGDTATASDYAPYQGQSVTIQLDQTVYGAKLYPLEGKALINMAMVDLGTLNWSVTGDRFTVATRLKPNPISRSTWGTDDSIAICSNYKYGNIGNGNGVDKAVGFYNGILFARDSTYTDAASFKTAMDGVQLVYELATPYEIQLTPHEVSSLLGQNNIWADTGDCSVEYRADTKLYIEKLTQPEEDDMIADSAITSGQFFMVGNTLYRALANIASGATITVGTNAQRVSLSDALNLVNA